MLSAGIMSEEEFNELISSGKTCVFDFSASWCGPCQMLAPVVEDIADKYKGQYYFYKIDVDSMQELAIKLGIVAVPTIVVFADGKEVGRTSGYMELEELDGFLKETLKVK